jgi:4'-phosphopantetheinyl transferase
MYHIFINDHLDNIDINTSLPALSEQRRQKALLYKFEQGRRECIAAYLLLRKALQDVYGIYEKPLFDYNKYGKPSIAGHPEIHFNLSHCKEAAICVVGDKALGVDVESVSEYDESVARYAMNDEELHIILNAPESAMAFTRLWTMKEAAVKMTGTGLGNRSEIKNLLDKPFCIKTVESKNHKYIYSICQKDN